VGVEEHFMALLRVGREVKGASGAQLGVGGQDLAIDAADERALFAPVELDSFAEFELELDEGGLEVFAAVVAPAPDILGDAGTLVC
jgi:hypothetical protein